MAINVQHSPSFVDYGQAIAGAQGQLTANDRLAQYGSYLAGLQQANQSYGLGLGNLGISQQRVGNESRSLDQGDFRNQLAAKELEFKIENAEDIAWANIVNAQSNRNSSYADLIGNQSRYGYF
jgi:hypothetical protein